MTDTFTLDDVIAALNRMVAADPITLRAMIEERLVCNTALRDDPDCQVVQDEDGQNSVGLLGILNGLFPSFTDGPRAGWGRIAARYDTVCGTCGSPQPDGVGEGDPCTNCSGIVVLGPLLGFQLTKNETQPQAEQGWDADGAPVD